MNSIEIFRGVESGTYAHNVMWIKEYLNPVACSDRFYWTRQIYKKFVAQNAT